MERALLKLPGVLDASVNLLTGLAEVGGGVRMGGQGKAREAGAGAGQSRRGVSQLQLGLQKQLGSAPAPTAACGRWSNVLMFWPHFALYCLPLCLQVRYDPDATGPRHLLAGVEAAGYRCTLFHEQRLGGCTQPWHTGSM